MTRKLFSTVSLPKYRPEPVTLKVVEAFVVVVVEVERKEEVVVKQIVVEIEMGKMEVVKIKAEVVVITRGF